MNILGLFRRYKMSKYILRNITPCSPLNVNRRFGGAHRIHVGVGENAEKETSLKAGDKLIENTSLLGLYNSLVICQVIEICSWSSKKVQLMRR
jgi:hypothetical protein